MQDSRLAIEEMREPFPAALPRRRQRRQRRQGRGGRAPNLCLRRCLVAVTARFKWPTWPSAALYNIRSIFRAFSAEFIVHLLYLSVFTLRGRPPGLTFGSPYTGTRFKVLSLRNAVYVWSLSSLVCILDHSACISQCFNAKSLI